MNCAGSINLSGQAPPDSGSVYADAGTAAHSIMERCLTAAVRPELFLDTIIQTGDMGTPVTVDEEMCEAVGVVLDYVEARKSEAGAKLVGVEVKFDLSPLNPPGPMFGRADVVLQDPGTKPQRSIDHNGNIQVIMPKPGLLEVVDFKYGQGTLVEVKGNSQLMYYALGAVVATNEIPVRIRVTIIQPRAPHLDGIVRSWVFEYAELKAFKKVLFERAAASMKEDAPLTPGDWCQFCPALAICPAQHRRAQDVARTEFENMVEVVEGGEEITPADLLPVPAALTLERLQEVMVAAPVYDAWIAAVRNHVRDLTERGEETGYKLVPKRGRRMWRDPALIERVLVHSLGDAAYTPPKLLSVTQAEKAAKAADTSIPPEMWEMVSSGTNLVPLDDPREALPPSSSARDDFEVVDLPGPELDPTLEHSEVSGYAIEVSGYAIEVFPDDDPTSFEAAAALLEGAVETLYPESPVPVGNADPVGQENADEIVVNTWMVEAGENEMFFVEANSETEAREAARIELGVARLPNHTQITPS
jgi:hypothetical protein